MKTAGKTFGIYLIVIVLFGIGLGFTGASNGVGPLGGIAFALGFSIRIFYVTIPLLAVVYFVLRNVQSAKVVKVERPQKPKEEK